MVSSHCQNSYKNLLIHGIYFTIIGKYWCSKIQIWLYQIRGIFCVIGDNICYWQCMTACWPKFKPSSMSSNGFPAQKFYEPLSPKCSKVQNPAPNTLLQVMYIMIICHWAILHYNMSFKTIALRSDGVFGWFPALSEESTNAFLLNCITMKLSEVVLALIKMKMDKIRGEGSMAIES